MATAIRDVEQIVRRVLREREDEALDAIEELSTLFTDQIIPKLPNGDGAPSEPEEDEEYEEELDDAVPMAAAAAGKVQPRRLSKRGAQFLSDFEGLKLKLYNDPAGHCTIGIGHLVHRGRCNGSEPAEFKRGLTKAQAIALLQRDVKRYEQPVNALRVPLNQNQFDALVSFTYNLGPGWTMENTGLRRALRQRRYKDVPAELNKWNKADGKVIPGLTRRRKAEGKLFMTPDGGGAPGPRPPQKPGVVNVTEVQPGQNNPSVLVLQKALAKAVGLDYSSGPGNFGPLTQKAYATWQRKCGVPANGRPEIKSLKMLGDKYGFKVAGGTAPAPKASRFSQSMAVTP